MRKGGTRIGALMDSQKRKHSDDCVIADKHTSPHENFQDQSKYNSESERLQTFALWPSDSAVDPSRLAKSGFYYTGKDDEVVCFSCQGHIKDWQYGDIVQRKHVEQFPSCDFVNNKSANVPLVNSRLTENNKIYRHLSEPIVNGTPSTTKEVMKQLSLAEKCVSNCAHSNEIRSRVNPNIRLSLEALFQEMKSEDKRLRTFKNGWPVPFIDAQELARAGFFYLGSGDRVQCPFCGVMVSKWEMGDKPLSEHRRHSSGCTFLSTLGGHNHKLTGETSWYKNKGYDVCGRDEGVFMASPRSEGKLLDRSQEHTKLEDLGVSLHRGPAHPQQATLAARLRSFISWPTSASVKKEDLANAGFFYIGISDHTKCFHCDGGLCSWEEGDDPWVEHARWFCNCSFVRLNKGDDFIKSCVAKYPAKDTVADNKDVDSSPMVVDDILTKTEEAMNSSLIQAVLETGVFSTYLIRAAVMRQLKETGSLFTSVDDVCEAVSYLQHLMEREPPQQLSVEENMVDLLNIKVTSVDETGGEEDAQVVPQTAGAKSCDDLPMETGKTPVNSFPEPPNGDLEEENKFLKDQRLCKVCMDNEVGVVFLPCGHLLACTVCAPALKLCPMCRKSIQATVRAYLP